MTPEHTGWRKSSYSAGTNNQCLEVADSVAGAVPVRDSTRPSGPTLTIPAGAWAALLAHVKH